VAIAVLEQLARPVARFRFSAEILRPPHPFVAPCITRGRQAIFVRNLISHAFPYLFESAPVPSTIPKFKRLADAQDQRFRADQFTTCVPRNAGIRQSEERQELRRRRDV